MFSCIEEAKDLTSDILYARALEFSSHGAGDVTFTEQFVVYGGATYEMRGEFYIEEHQLVNFDFGIELVGICL